MFQLAFDENTKKVLMTALDVYVRQVGSDLSKAGGQATAEAAMLLISIHNAAAAVSQAPEIPPENPGEKEKPVDPKKKSKD